MTMIVMVGGPQTTVGNMDVDEIKENVAQLVRKPKTDTPSVTKSRCCLRSEQRIRNAWLKSTIKSIRAACDEIDVTFVDIKCQFPFPKLHSRLSCLVKISHYDTFPLLTSFIAFCIFVLSSSFMFGLR